MGNKINALKIKFAKEKERFDRERDLDLSYLKLDNLRGGAYWKRHMGRCSLPYSYQPFSHRHEPKITDFEENLN
jgi:hypothetical protein